MQKPSQLYQILVKAPGELMMYLMVYSTERLVQDRIRNYFQKYLPLSLEVTDEAVSNISNASLEAVFIKG